MNYTVVCKCGKPHSVTANETGERLICSCEQTVVVPQMPKTTRQLIKSLVADGRLPVNDLCPISGEPADTTVVMTILRTPLQDNFIPNPLTDTVAGEFLGLPWKLLKLVRSGHATPEPDPDLAGGTILANAPIRIAAASRKTIIKASQRKLIRILRTVPIYAHLLDEYPQASVIVNLEEHS
jgi:hypothetical protein